MKKTIRQRIFKFLTGIDSEKIKTIDRNLSFTTEELNETYLFDFKNYQGQYVNTNSGNVIFGITENESDADSSSDENKITPKIRVKTIEVLEELETIPTPFNLILLDEKICMLMEKRRLIVQHYAKREVEGLLERLENRKKYSEFKEFFDSFPNTNDEKIDKLLSKYDLVMKTSDIFVPEFPDDAIEVMKKYTDKMMELCNKKPLFYVIATPDKFEEKYKQRDPILLVQSPFGFYWQILGAWDEEMLILEEL